MELLKRKQIVARRWKAEDGDEIAPRQFPTGMQLWCAEGQFNCTIEGKTYSLQSGDVLDVPANLRCDIRVGFGGCVCYESAAKAASL